MRLVLDQRARRLLRRLPRRTWYSLAEIAALLVLAVTCARLLLTILTPVGPIGDWRPERPNAAASPFGLVRSFDPFFRLSAAAAGPIVVTGLALKLFGTRADQASGRGSAIIGLPDGTQTSFAVGEQILPGVTLKAVGFDSATITRGVADELIYLDQSQPATTAAVQPGGGGTVAPAEILAAATSSPAVQAAALLQQTRLAPRLDGGTVTGFTLNPNGAAEAFHAAGFQAGDVLVSVNGAPVSGVEDAARVQAQLTRSGEAAVEVERAGQRIPLRVKVDQ